MNRAALALPPRRRIGNRAALAAAACLLGLTVLAALATGAVPLSPGRVLAALMGDATPRDVAIVHTLRLPRTLAAALIGAVLGAGGAVMQGLFRNPLADPGLLGVSAGGAMGAVATIVFGAAFLPAWLQPHAGAAAAFAGALGVTLVVQRLATVEGRVLVGAMLLAGIVFNTLAGAVTGMLIFAADDMQLRDIMFWTMGSVAGATPAKLGLITAAALPLLVAAPLLARALNALILGEREALSLGIPVERVKRLAVILVALAVGASVAAAGMITFVGVIAPHLCRLARGADHRFVLPASALAGAVLLVAADTVARTVLAPAELPIGLVTALIGGPFFLALLLRQRLAVDGS